MNQQPRTLRFLWWNVESFAHFERRRAGEKRWPLQQPVYEAKAKRVEDVLRQLFADELPDLLAFAEITNKAAIGLRDRVCRTHTVFSLDMIAKRPEFQVAFVYNTTRGGFEEREPIVVPNMPPSTRPMAVLDFVAGNHRLRFIACHWPARFEDDSDERRRDIASFLMTHVYDFLRSRDRKETRHVVILGDLNIEPYGLLEKRLHTSRSREPSRRRRHGTDKAVKRIRLYNAAWRFLGERSPHLGGSAAGDTAGTLFWKEKRTWHTFDHLIVSGGLLTESPPYLDETSVRVLTCPLLLAPEGIPQPFDWRNGNPIGVSDHLPIAGQIVLQRGDDYDDI